MAKKKETEQKENKLLEAIKLINEKWGGSEKGSMPIPLEKPEIPISTSGSLAIDYASYCGGIPNGRIYEFYGLESSGKTTAALKIASECLKQGRNVIFCDVEQALNPLWVEKLGVKISLPSDLLKPAEDGKGRFIINKAESLEAVMSSIKKLIETDLVGLVIVDSVAALATLDNIQSEELEGNGMPLFPKKFKNQLVLLNPIAAKHNCNVIFINHLMDKVKSGFGKSFGPQETTPGGRALKFLSSMRLKFAKIETVKDRDDVKSANRVKVTFTKNKVAPPYGEGIFSLDFKKGWDTVQEIIDYAIWFGFLKKEGSRAYIYNDEKIANSSYEIYEKIESNPELKNDLYNKIVEEIKKRAKQIWENSKEDFSISSENDFEEELSNSDMDEE